MTPTLVVIALVAIGVAVFWRARQEQNRRLVERYTIEANDLHELLGTEDAPRIFDVRQPLELLAHAEIIPGSERVEPKAVLADLTLIPKDEATIVYCTCPGDSTSRTVLRKALALGLKQTKILRGGLDSWKEMGYPVEEYRTTFHLDTPA